MVGVNLRSNRYIRISHEFPENIDGYAGCLEVRTVRMLVTIQHQVIHKRIRWYQLISIHFTSHGYVESMFEDLPHPLLGLCVISGTHLSGAYIFKRSPPSLEQAKGYLGWVRSYSRPHSSAIQWFHRFSVPGLFL